MCVFLWERRQFVPLGWCVDPIRAKRGGVLLIIAQTNGDTVTYDHSTSTV